MTERLKDWKLKDIDIWREIDPLPVVQADHPSTDDEMLPVYRAIATAAAKKVVEWMNENGKIAYDRHAIASEFTVVASEFTVPIHKWQSLKQEVGL